MATSQPLPYTANPVRLALQDLALFLRLTFTWPITTGLPSIILPFYPYKSGPLDELYPNGPNLWALFLHAVLLILQGAFLLQLIPSLLFGLPVPFFAWTPTCIISCVAIYLGNKAICLLLNGKTRKFNSISDESWESHPDEKWIFVNGVAAGATWMQSNLDRLALTFRRPVHGIHNRTSGIIFDVIEVILQRTFGYFTNDVREIYAEVLKNIEEKVDGKPKHRKIILVLHSQGCVEGGLMLDWLFATVEQERLKTMEIYTFGCAANHFNSPEYEDGKRVIQHIEHYTNLGDWVSLFGILNFRPLPWKSATQSPTIQRQLRNRYVGRLFVRKGSGHQMNGNYLDNFFEMSTTPEGKLVKVKEDNEYMSVELNEPVLRLYGVASPLADKDVWQSGEDEAWQVKDKLKMKDASRLWEYRNGQVPKDD